MPQIDLGSVVGPQGPQGNTGPQGAQGIQGISGPNQVTGSTSTTFGATDAPVVLTGNGSKVGYKPIDSSPAANTNLITSGGVNAALNELRGATPKQGSTTISANGSASINFGAAGASAIRFAVLIATTGNSNLSNKSSLYLVTGFGLAAANRLVTPIVAGTDITITGTDAGFRVSSSSAVYCSFTVLIDASNSIQFAS